MRATAASFHAPAGSASRCIVGQRRAPARTRTDRRVIHHDAAQRQEVEHLAGQVEQRRRAVTAVLELAEDLKDTTIEVLLRKSHLEVGLEALLGQEPHRRRQRQS